MEREVWSVENILPPAVTGSSRSVAVSLSNATPVSTKGTASSASVTPFQPSNDTQSGIANMEAALVSLKNLGAAGFCKSDKFLGLRVRRGSVIHALTIQESESMEVL